jgi:hypothetical protein
LTCISLCFLSLLLYSKSDKKLFFRRIPNPNKSELFEMLG